MYVYYNSEVTWEAAKQACESNSKRLAIAIDMNKQNAIKWAAFIQWCACKSSFKNAFYRFRGAPFYQKKNAGLFVKFPFGTATILWKAISCETQNLELWISTPPSWSLLLTVRYCSACVLQFFHCSFSSLGLGKGKLNINSWKGDLVHHLQFVSYNRGCLLRCNFRH